jgi:hypothetical protein
MNKTLLAGVVLFSLVIVMGGCEHWIGPDRKGEIRLSSELFGTESYYLFGYSYEDGEYYRYPYRSERVPDIINEAYRVIQGTDINLLPGFNTPGQANGFALVGALENLETARNFFNEYREVESGLQFETISDTVALYQVWIQKTSLDNYVKLMVKDIRTVEGDGGKLYCEVALDFVYQPDGSTGFPK